MYCSSFLALPPLLMIFIEKYEASSIVFSSEGEKVWNFGSAPELSIKYYQLEGYKITTK